MKAVSLAILVSALLPALASASVAKLSYEQNGIISLGANKLYKERMHKAVDVSGSSISIGEEHSGMMEVDFAVYEGNDKFTQCTMNMNLKSNQLSDGQCKTLKQIARKSKCETVATQAATEKAGKGLPKDAESSAAVYPASKGTTLISVDFFTSYATDSESGEFPEGSYNVRVKNSNCEIISVDERSPLY